jgi:hypothetical protein
MKIDKKYIHQSGRYKKKLNQKALKIADASSFSYRDPHPTAKNVFFGGLEKSGRQHWITKEQLRPLKISKLPTGIPIKSSGRQKGRINQDILQTGKPQGTFGLGDKHPNKKYTNTFFIKFQNATDIRTTREIWGTAEQINRTKELSTKANTKIKNDPVKWKNKLKQDAEYRKKNRTKLKLFYKKFYIKNAEKIKTKVKEYRKNNLERVLKLEKLSRDKNKTKLRKYFREFHAKRKHDLDYRLRRKKSADKLKNCPIQKEKARAYQKANREKINKYQRKYYLDPSKKLRRTVSTRIQCAVKDGLVESKKLSNLEDLIGCTLEELKTHLESQFQKGMTWKNMGKNGWHIDHIIPCDFFDMTKLKHQKICFNYKNLQPLWAVDNIKKGNSIPLVLALTILMLHKKN